MVCLQFSGFIHYDHFRKQGSIQADTGAREGPESSYILTHRQQEVVWYSGCDLSVYETPKPIPTVIHFIQKDNTPPTKSHLLIVTLILVAIFFRTNIGTAINIHKQTQVWMYFQLLWVNYQWTKLLRYTIRSYFICKSNTNCLPKYIYYFAFLPGVNGSPYCFTYLPAFAVLSLPDTGCSALCAMVLHCGCNCVHLETYDFRHLFTWLLSIFLPSRVIVEALITANCTL